MHIGWILLLLGGLSILASVLDYRDVLPHGTDREGMFDNVYTFWAFGLFLAVTGVGELLGDPRPGWVEPVFGVGYLFLIPFTLYSMIARPRWMWPRWRHEMERRKQEREAAARLRGEEGRA